MRRFLILIFLVFLVAILSFVINYYIKSNNNVEIYKISNNNQDIQDKEIDYQETNRSEIGNQNKELEKEIQILEIKNITQKNKEVLLNTTSPEEETKISTDNQEEEKIEITIEASEFKFEPNVIEVKEKQNVVIKIKNKGTIPHNFKIEKENFFIAQSSLIAPGETATLEFKAPSRGEYDFYCSIGNHKLRGMFGKFIVR